MESTLHPLPSTFEVLVIGGGPAGLTAALYLARFRRRVAVLEHGRSRARLIPISRNDPGFDDGVSGDDLLRRLRRQVRQYGTPIHSIAAERISRDESGAFQVHTGPMALQAATILLATGVSDVVPPGRHVQNAIRRGILRLCPVCDGYETRNQRIAVYGSIAIAARHARFLRSFTRTVHVLASEPYSPPEWDRACAAQDVGGIVVEQGPWRLDAKGESAVCTNEEGDRRIFDMVYLMLGARPNTGLVASLGPRCDDAGYIQTDSQQQTSVAGLYAAGDVACAINQICVGTGQAAIAASAIHRQLPFRPYDP